MNELIKEGLRIFLPIALVLFIIFLTIIGGIRVSKYVKYKTNYESSSPRKGLLKIDSVNFFYSLNSDLSWETGKGHIVGDNGYNFSVSLLNFERDQLNNTSTWEEHLIQEDSLFSVWYNYTGWVILDATASSSVIKAKMKKRIRRQFFLVISWFVPLFFYGFFIIIRKRLKA